MRGIQITEYLKGPEQLKVSDLPDPKPTDDEYLIQVHAAAANFFDILQIQGKYQNQPPFPWIAGAEFAGTVIATPKDSSNPKFPVGSRVFGASQGAFATKIKAIEDTLLPVPDGWSFKEAAGLFVTAPTSYGALVVRRVSRRAITYLSMLQLVVLVLQPFKWPRLLARLSLRQLLHSISSISQSLMALTMLSLTTTLHGPLRSRL
ncbi:hypothetical protein NW765_001914 [Fusarium oxysporum]|nr:hypothetical protein NW765_001914 [Fusarium oxysporum]